MRTLSTGVVLFLRTRSSLVQDAGATRTSMMTSSGCCNRRTTMKKVSVTTINNKKIFSLFN